MLLTLSVPHEGCLKELRSNEKIKLILNVHISKCTDLCACVQTVIQIKKPLLPSCISKPWWNRLLFRRPGLMTFLSGLLFCRKFVVLIHYLKLHSDAFLECGTPMKKRAVWTAGAQLTKPFQIVPRLSSEQYNLCKWPCDLGDEVKATCVMSKSAFTEDHHHAQHEGPSSNSFQVIKWTVKFTKVTLWPWEWGEGHSFTV